MVIDPVCGMPLNKALAASQSEHGGHVYYFCVKECQEKFAAEPMLYLMAAPKQGVSQLVTRESEVSPCKP